jgi:hypothetical protein
MMMMMMMMMMIMITRRRRRRRRKITGYMMLARAVNVPHGARSEQRPLMADESVRRRVSRIPHALVAVITRGEEDGGVVWSRCGQARELAVKTG